MLSAWGPQPVGWLWVGSQVDYHSGSVFLGITVAFLGLIGSLIVTLAIADAARPPLARCCGARPATTSARACSGGSSW